MSTLKRTNRSLIPLDEFGKDKMYTAFMVGLGATRSVAAFTLLYAMFQFLMLTLLAFSKLPAFVSAWIRLQRLHIKHNKAVGQAVDQGDFTHYVHTAIEKWADVNGDS